MDILLSKGCHPGLELRAWSLEKGFTTQSSKLKALSNEDTKPLEQDISTLIKYRLDFSGFYMGVRGFDLKLNCYSSTKRYSRG